jgi:alanyl-tRNA synthetase
MTERLYYADAYLCEFTARVLDCRADEAGFRVRLDRSAFYPTSGGQPHDAGTLGGADVLDVCADPDGEVWHVLSAPLAVGAEVFGAIDWARRFEHMQQHAGEHMLAYELFEKYKGETIGLHLGAEVSTIDVNMPGGATRISLEEVAALEDRVNAKIQADLPIRCWFPEAEELKALPLRKPPTVAEHVRVVQIGDELVACGGTHPATAGQIGLMKVLDARPSKGKMRVTFVCGMRAFTLLRANFNAAQGAAALLSADASALINAVARLKEREKDARALSARLARENALARLEGVTPVPIGGAALYCLSFPGIDDKALKEIALTLVGARACVALVEAAGEDGRLLVFARSEGLPYDMGALMGECARALGGKGGGRSEFAQGSAPTDGALALAKDKILAHSINIE